LKERDNLGDLRIAGTILLKWELNRIWMFSLESTNSEEGSSVGSCDHDKDINIRVEKQAVNFSISWETISFPRLFRSIKVGSYYNLCTMSKICLKLKHNRNVHTSRSVLIFHRRKYLSDLEEIWYWDLPTQVIGRIYFCPMQNLLMFSSNRLYLTPQRFQVYLDSMQFCSYSTSSFETADPYLL
jgi:hypothetical protein